MIYKILTRLNSKSDVSLVVRTFPTAVTGDFDELVVIIYTGSEEFGTVVWVFWDWFWRQGTVMRAKLVLKLIEWDSVRSLSADTDTDTTWSPFAVTPKHNEEELDSHVSFFAHRFPDKTFPPSIILLYIHSIAFDVREP